MREINFGIRKRIAGRQALKRSAWTRDKVAIAIAVPEEFRDEVEFRDAPGHRQDIDLANVTLRSWPGGLDVCVWTRRRAAGFVVAQIPSCFAPRILVG